MAGRKRVGLWSGLLSSFWMTAATGAPPVVNRTCTDAITLRQPLCEPGQFNAVGGHFELFAKAKRISINGANSTNMLPAVFTAYVFDFTADPTSGSLAPPVWHISKRFPETRESLGTLRVTLHNLLPPVSNNTFMLNGAIPAGDQPLNLHTHGMMVSPHDADENGAYGDFVGVLACPATTKPACPQDVENVQMTEICGLVKSAADNHACSNEHLSHGDNLIHGHKILFDSISYALAIPGDHPASFNWFHPHAHEISSPQVGAGLGGVITIGSLCADPALSAASRKAICTTAGDAELNSSIKERVLMLKDLQVYSNRPGDKSPGDPEEASAEGYRIVPTCKFGDRPHVVTDGFCVFDPPDSTAPGGNWLFTVNGQIQPSISMQLGTPELWRIANLSSNETYRLSLCKSAPKPDQTPGWIGVAEGAPDPRKDLATCENFKHFQILSLDGGLIPGAHGLGEQTEALLPPGARAEILIEPMASETFKLVHKGFAEDELYPPVVLATVKTKAGIKHVTPFISFVNARPPADRQPASFEEPEDCKIKPEGLGPNDWASLSTQDEIVSVFFNKIWDYPEVLTLGFMQGNPETSSDPKIREKIAACLKEGDPDSLNCQAFAGAAFTMEHRNLCAKFGTKITFRLYNLTDDIHNFHIHQQRFTVDTAETNSNPDSSAARMLENAIEHKTVLHHRGTAPVSLVDSVPVLSAWERDENGKVKDRNPVETVTMTFDKPEQVGDFVFHCHILEHEDKGMMKRMTIYTDSPK